MKLNLNNLKLIHKIAYGLAILFAVIAIIFKDNNLILFIFIGIGIFFVILAFLVKSKILKTEELLKKVKIDNYENQFGLELERKKNDCEAYKLMHIIFTNDNKEIEALVKKNCLNRYVEIQYNSDLKLCLESEVNSYNDKKNKYFLEITKDYIKFNSKNLNLPLTKDNEYIIKDLLANDLLNYIIKDLKKYK